MTPEQAIAILDKVTSLMEMNRADHFNAQKAVEVLMSLISEKKKAEFPKDIKKAE